MHIQFYWVYLIALIGFLYGTMGGIAFVKGVRGDGKSLPWYELILSSVLLGGPGVLLVYLLSKEVRTEDKIRRHVVLITTIASILVEILIIVLLSCFGVIVYKS